MPRLRRQYLKINVLLVIQVVFFLSNIWMCEADQHSSTELLSATCNGTVQYGPYGSAWNLTNPRGSSNPRQCHWNFSVNSNDVLQVSINSQAMDLWSKESPCLVLKGEEEQKFNQMHMARKERGAGVESCFYKSVNITFYPARCPSSDPSHSVHISVHKRQEGGQYCYKQTMQTFDCQNSQAVYRSSNEPCTANIQMPTRRPISSPAPLSDTIKTRRKTSGHMLVTTLAPVVTEDRGVKHLTPAFTNNNITTQQPFPMYVVILIITCGMIPFIVGLVLIVLVLYKKWSAYSRPSVVHHYYVDHHDDETGEKKPPKSRRPPVSSQHRRQPSHRMPRSTHVSNSSSDYDDISIPTRASELADSIPETEHDVDVDVQLPIRCALDSSYSEAEDSSDYGKPKGYQTLDKDDVGYLSVYTALQGSEQGGEM